MYEIILLFEMSSFIWIYYSDFSKACEEGVWKGMVKKIFGRAIARVQVIFDVIEFLGICVFKLRVWSILIN